MNLDLNRIFETGEYEDHGSYHIVGALWSDADLTLDISLNSGVEGEAPQIWRIVARSVRFQRIEKEYDDRISEHSDHPVLLPYKDRVGILYFSQFDSDLKELLGSLYLLTKKLTGGWIQIDSIVNLGAFTVPGPSGCLAEGPVSLLSEYKKEIEKRGGKGTILKERDPLKWDGEKWIEEDKNLKALLLGDSYIVARDFEYIKHKSSSEGH